MSCRPVRPIGRHATTAILILAMTVFPFGNGPLVFAQDANGLQIAILEGSNNVIKNSKDSRLVIEVRDRLKSPVAGADVTFIAPDSGPGILFAGNASLMRLKTDSRGRVDTGPNRPIGEGAFTVRIVASFQGEITATSAQSVNKTQSTETKKKSSALKWILIAAAGGAAGAVLATRKSDGSSGATGGGQGSSGTTITAGTPTVGAPQ